MKKLVLLLIPFALSIQANEIPKKTIKNNYLNAEHVKAANEVDSSKYCFHDNKLVARNGIVEMGGGILMQCKNVSINSAEVYLEWREYK